MSSNSVLVRSAVAALFALLLALRLLGSAGYMPTVERGALTIVACPDADANAPLAIAPAHHHRHDKTKHHDPCPYAAAGALGFVTDHPAPLLGLLAIGLARWLGRALLFVERQSRRDRPPTTGPPLRA